MFSTLVHKSYSLESGQDFFNTSEENQEALTAAPVQKKAPTKRQRKRTKIGKKPTNKRRGKNKLLASLPYKFHIMQVSLQFMQVSLQFMQVSLQFMQVSLQFMQVSLQFMQVSL